MSELICGRCGKAPSPECRAVLPNNTRPNLPASQPPAFSLDEALRMLQARLGLQPEADAAKLAIRTEIERLREKADAYDRINTPEIDDFLAAVKNEALHQRERWSVEHDGGKEASDWFWLLGYLAGKALHDVKGKRLHHLITAAASLLNWHGQETGHYAAMRPGILPPTGIRGE